MAWFGNQTTTTAEAIAAVTKRGAKFTCPMAFGTCDSISAYCNRTVSGSGYAVDAAIYNDSSGAPGSLVANSSIQLSSNITRNSPAWYTGTYGTKPTLTPGNVYWLVVLFTKAGSTYYASGASNQQATRADTLPFDDPFGASPTYAAYKTAIYVTYTPATIDLVPDEGSQDQAGDGNAITQTQVLAPAEGAQDQVGDLNAITQLHLLTPAEGAQDQAGDVQTISVTTDVNLVPAEGSQEQAGDNQALTQLHVLAPAEAAQEQAGDVQALTQVHVFTPAEGAQEQAGDAQALTQTHVLAPSKGSQEQAGDNQAIEVGIVALLPDEGSQEQAGDGAALTQTHVLAPAEGAQDQEGGLNALTQAHGLTPAEGAQDQAGDEAALGQVHVLAPAEGAQDQEGDNQTIEIGAPSEVNLVPAEGAQDQAGDSPSLIMGLLESYEFIDRLLLEDRIVKARLRREREVKIIQQKIKKVRIGSQPPDVVGSEILLNGNFENWTSDAVPASWSVVPAGSGASLLKLAAAAVSGNWGGRIYTGTLGSVRVFQTATLTAGTRYFFGAWLFPDPAKPIWLSVMRNTGSQYLRANGTWGSGDTGAAIATPPGLPAPSFYRYVHVCFVAPVSGIHIFSIRSNQAGQARATHWFDEASLFEIGLYGFLDRRKVHQTRPEMRIRRMI